MILKNSSNRAIIKNYLETISEDELIDEIIIPLYSSLGYSVLRVVTHGPGEHGKDVIFTRYVSALFDNECLVIQAKAQNVNVSNLVHMSNQLIRALRTPVTGISGGSSYYPNYVVFFNSKGVTNDANWEFPYLVDGKNNIKIIAQDNVCELILAHSVIPLGLSGQLSMEASSTSETQENKSIKEALYRNKPDEVQHVFENVIPICKAQLSADTRRVIIDYIFKLWREDKGWSGTVKPMRWLNRCFELMHEDQYRYLIEVLYEHTSDYPSYEAKADVAQIVEKITAAQYRAIRTAFLSRIADGGEKYSWSNSILVRKFMLFTSPPNDLSDVEKQFRESLVRIGELELKFDRTKDEEIELGRKKISIRAKCAELKDSDDITNKPIP